MNVQKRLPSIFGLGLTAVLVFFVLPNPLNIPNNDPTAQAEFAPMPGENEDPTNANFSETSTAGSEASVFRWLQLEVSPLEDGRPMSFTRRL